jgi:hypothetical protein
MDVAPHLVAEISTVVGDAEDKALDGICDRFWRCRWMWPPTGLAEISSAFGFVALRRRCAASGPGPDAKRYHS